MSFDEWNALQTEESFERREEFLKELLKSGYITQACRALGMSSSTVYKWKNQDEEFAAKLKEVRKVGRIKTDDYVESKLIEKIKDGDTTAIIFYCKTRMRYRGYSQTDISIQMNKETNVTNVVNNISIETEADLEEELRKTASKIQEYRAAAFPESNKE